MSEKDDVNKVVKNTIVPTIVSGAELAITVTALGSSLKTISKLFDDIDEPKEKKVEEKKKNNV
jgi:hypothetical protein